MIDKHTKGFKTHIETSVYSYLGELTCSNELTDVVKAKQEVLDWIIAVLDRTEQDMNKCKSESGFRKFKVKCDVCNGTGNDGDCEWCMASGYTIVTVYDDIVPLGAIEELSI
jgi:hypothetical protein